MKKIHLIMPMAGRGSRFDREGYECPKPMLEIYGKPFFYWSTESIKKFVEPVSLTFVVLKEHVDKFGIDAKIKSYYPDAEIVVLQDVTAGAVITCYEGIRNINDCYPLVFNDCDHLFKSNEFNAYCKRNNEDDVDGILLTFKSDKPVYSFVGFDENGFVNKTVEKVAISNDAICGCYYFRNKETFIKAEKEYLEKCAYSEYFVSGVYNVMIEHSKKIVNMNTDFHVPFGIPEEYDNAKNDLNYLELI